MKIPKNTEQISIGNGKIIFFGKNNKLILSEELKNINYSEFFSFDAINCSCEGHMITLSVIDDDIEDDYVYLSSWNRSRSLPYCWSYRIKTAWEVLCGKIPFLDEFLFTRSQLLVFRALIDKYIKVLEEKKKMVKAKDKEKNKKKI